MAQSVILLRHQRPDDPYIRVFAEAGFEATCVPVLAFRFPAQNRLAEHLSESEKYEGLILTSPRATDALQKVTENTPTLLDFWKTKTTYVVGPRTAERATALGLRTEGGGTGDAATLSEVIPVGKRPLLFLAGSRRRDVLPKSLAERGVSFVELCVYETHPREDISTDELQADWLAFFSPSGIEAVEGVMPQNDVRIAAIGSTTASSLAERGFRLDAVADAPTPEGLLRAIAESSLDAE